MESPTRQKLLEAACRLLLEEGVARLTLSAVAARAGVSKGGLLYHFGTKEALVLAMLDHALQRFEEGIEAYVEQDREPGGWLRGYVRVSFSPAGTDMAMYATIGAALVATMGTDVRMLEAFLRHEKIWQQRAEKDGVDPVRVASVRAAVDGVWLQAALGLDPRDVRERTALMDGLVALSRPGDA